LVYYLKLKVGLCLQLRTTAYSGLQENPEPLNRSTLNRVNSSFVYIR
jgi:hypothetical protein